VHGTLAADATVLTKKSRARRSATNGTQRLVIRNRQQLVGNSTLIISALQEALDYDPGRHHNQPPPALRIDDANYFRDIRALIAELKRLNELLEKSRPQRGEPKRTIINVRKHINVFLENYVPLFARGTACVTVAAMAGLLHYAGVEENIVMGILTAANLRWGHLSK
jgi:hypothetical protein